MPAAIVELTGGGAHVSLDALGAATTCANSIRSLRPRGRHVQVGLLPPAQGRPEVPMERVIGLELQVLGSHGMAAHAYPELLGLIAAGRLDPRPLVTRRLALDDAGGGAGRGGPGARASPSSRPSDLLVGTCGPRPVRLPDMSWHIRLALSKLTR